MGKLEENKIIDELLRNAVNAAHCGKKYCVWEEMKKKGINEYDGKKLCKGLNMKI